MKKMIAVALLSAAAVSLCLVVAQTDEKNPDRAGRRARGTVSAWDDATKTFKVKSDTGEEIVLVWNERTEIEGTPRVGEQVRVKFRKDKDGKIWAMRVAAGHPARKSRADGTTTPK